jgi:DNA-binding transcriptional ArsR family regulator
MSAGRIPSPGPNLRKWNVIDRLRDQIQERLDQLAGEADRLRKALVALDPRSSKTPPRKAPPRKGTETIGSKAVASGTRRAPAQQTRRPATRPPRRTAPSATKASVLAALAGGEAMTASEVATEAGLPRGTVSTTLSRLAKRGEVEKAERGYRLPAATTSRSSPDA